MNSVFSLYHMDAEMARCQKERELQVRNLALVREATRKPKTRYQMLLRLGVLLSAVDGLLQARNHAPAACC